MFPRKHSQIDTVPSIPEQLKNTLLADAAEFIRWHYNGRYTVEEYLAALDQSYEPKVKLPRFIKIERKK